jgi:hypothetical protein
MLTQHSVSGMLRLCHCQPCFASVPHQSPLSSRLPSTAAKRSRFVRVRSQGVDEAGLAAVLNEYESHAKGAVYCAVPDHLFRGEFADLLRKRGYAFWVRIIYTRSCVGFARHH